MHAEALAARPTTRGRVAAAPARRVSLRATPAVVATWLFACCALVFAMVVVGGVTRLTHSGLSIVEWQPIVGTLPPLDDAAWQQAFARYQATPEFRLVNHAMDVHAFKSIFWWEYFHRLLGRAIGVAFVVPLAWFAARPPVERSRRKLAAIFALGGLQGAMGWYMVQSGLVDDPRVSHFRLTAHLGLAFAIFARHVLERALAARFAAASAGTRQAPATRRACAACGMRRLAALVFVMALAAEWSPGFAPAWRTTRSRR